MKYILASILFGVVVVAPHFALAKTPQQAALEYVCAAKKLDCSRIAPPRVRYAELVYLAQYYGYFWYEHSANTVWLDVQFEQNPWDVQSMATLIHETTHYVDHILQADIQGCATESNAFALSNLYLLEHGHADLAQWNWFVWYGCPAPGAS